MEKPVHEFWSHEHLLDYVFRTLDNRVLKRLITVSKRAKSTAVSILKQDRKQDGMFLEILAILKGFEMQSHGRRDVEASSSDGKTGYRLCLVYNRLKYVHVMFDQTDDGKLIREESVVIHLDHMRVRNHGQRRRIRHPLPADIIGFVSKTLYEGFDAEYSAAI